MFTGHSSERSSSTLHLDAVDITRLAAEARRIATEEALAARSPLAQGPTPHEATDRNARSDHSVTDRSVNSSTDRSVRSDHGVADQQPEVAIIDTVPERPISSSYGAAAPRWNTSRAARTLPSEHAPTATSGHAPAASQASKDEDTKLSTREAAMKLLDGNAEKYR